MASRFLRSRPTTTWAASTAYSLGDRRLSTGTVPALGIHFEVTTAGTSGGTEPTWNTTVGGTTSDGSVTWTTRGSAAVWVLSTAYVVGDRVVATTSAIASRRALVFECTTAGTSGGTEPSWSTTVGGTQTDNTVTWTVRDVTSWDNATINFFRIGDSDSNNLLAGDQIFVGDEHTEAGTVATVFDAPATTITNPLLLVCVNDTGDPASPTTLATTAVIGSANGISIDIRGIAIYIYGITFSVGNGGASAANLALGAATARSHIELENCALRLNNTSTTSLIRVGASSGSAPARIRLRNTTVQFGSVSQAIGGGCALFLWEDTPSAIVGATLPTSLFRPTSGSGGQVIMRGIDISAIGSGESLVVTSAAASTQRAMDFLLQNCKIDSALDIIDVTAEALTLGDYTVTLVSTSDTDATINFYRETAIATIQEETTLVRSGGASDGTTTYAWKVVTTAVGSRQISEALPTIATWNQDVGSPVTATVEILHDSATALTDSEVWLEVEYLGTSGSTRSTIDTDEGPILAAGTAQTSSSVTWTTTGMTNPNKQKLEVTFTPQEPGPIRAVVRVAKDSYTLYVDPLITLT